MPVQTANTLFRFTSDFKYLLKFLSNGFHPRLSREISIKSGDRNLSMVCFCDIPLSMVTNHMGKYGQYGIGMTKGWGINKGLNPVLYYNAKSILIEKFFELTNSGKSTSYEQYILSVNGKWIDNPGGGRSPEVDYTIDGYAAKREAFWKSFYRMQAIEGLESYFKPHVGEYEIDGKYYPNYHFYDEREWRFLPLNFNFDSNFTDQVDEVKIPLGPLSDEEKERINTQIELEGKNKLDFTAADIKYIIVKNDSEIIPLIRHLESLTNQTAGGLRFTQDEVLLLTSRILTNDQITIDF
jgi:hypothetical protein